MPRHHSHGRGALEGMAQRRDDDSTDPSQWDVAGELALVLHASFVHAKHGALRTPSSCFMVVFHLFTVGGSAWQHCCFIFLQANLREAASPVPVCPDTYRLDRKTLACLGGVC